MRNPARVAANVVRLYRVKRKSDCGKHCSFAKDLTLIGPQFITFGNGCYIGPHSRIEAWSRYGGQVFEPSIVFGNRVRINSRCHIGAISRIEVGDDTLMGSGVFISDHSHGRICAEEAEIAPNDRDLYSKGSVVIGDKVWIGENVVIMPGVTVGRCSIIGAMSVVTHDVPPFSVVAGNPARVIKTLR